MFKTIAITVLLFALVFPCQAQVALGSPEERLFQAVWDNDFVKVQKSLDDGANVLAENLTGETAADVAVDKGYFEVAHYLLQRVGQLKAFQAKTKTPDIMPEPIQETQPLARVESAPKVIAPKAFMTDENPFAPSSPIQSSLTAPQYEPLRVVEPEPKKQPQITPVQKVEPIVEQKPEPRPSETLLTKPIFVKPFEEKVEVKAIAITQPKRSRKIAHKNLQESLSIALGKAPPQKVPKIPEPCIHKGTTVTVCIEKTSWSKGLFNHFDDLRVSIYKRLGEGNRAVVGYRNGTSNFVKTIFAIADYEAVVEHFSNRYGDADQREKRVVAPLGKPQEPNIVLSWYGHDAVTNRETVLQIVQYDVTQGRFSNMTKGAVIYKYFNEPPLFSYVNPIELVRIP